MSENTSIKGCSNEKENVAFGIIMVDFGNDLVNLLASVSKFFIIQVLNINFTAFLKVYFY